jgi:hypothetical protein
VSLPISTVETADVELSGGVVRVQGRACRDATEWEADALCIAWGADLDVSEVRAWLENASAVDSTKLIETIMRLSGMGAAARFQE